MSDTSTTSETALDRAFALLKCSPIKDPENSSEYGRAAYNLSEHCQGKEDVSEAAMRIFAHRIAELEHELEEYRSIAENIGAEKAVSEKEKAISERDEAREELRAFKRERDELQNNLKRAITELDLASIEIFKWERDFTILVNDFKAFANSIKKQ